MWCVCIDKETGNLFVIERSERETMISVLQNIGKEIPSRVLADKDTKEDAEQYLKDINDADDLIDKTLL